MVTTISTQKHFDEIANSYDFYKAKNSFYYRNLKKLLSSLIPSNSRILEVGCGTGDLISYLNPKEGLGFDISQNMINIAKNKHKDVNFSTRWPKRKFKYIFMSDVIEHLENPKVVFSQISKLMNNDSVFICTMANPIWEPLLMIGEKLKMPEGLHNRIKYNDLRPMIQDSGMKIIDHDYKLLIPIEIPIVTKFANKYLEHLFKKLAFIEYFTATKL